LIQGLPALRRARPVVALRGAAPTDLRHL